VEKLMPPAPDQKHEERSGEVPQDTGEQSGTEGDNSRRRFLRISLTLGLVLAVGGIASVARSLFSPPTPEPSPPPPAAQTVTETVTVGSTGASSNTSTSTESSASTTSSPFPRVKVANASDLSGGQTVTFNYPLDNTPNLLAKLGQKADGGVGPDGDIVAFSQVCQHLGCIWGYVPTSGSPKCDSSYKASGPVGYCCCHGSVYDLLNGAKVIEGPSPRAQPQVTLVYDSPTGDIYAIGMGPPTIFGHDTGSDDVLNDLQGGTVVG
jgi:arsenite oxidase small subunit